METELLKVFDENGRCLGTAERKEVHRQGFWHETFHCWMTERHLDRMYLYFQLRSPLKKDYPSLFDITAAGHLLADETAADGVRELEEELGLSILFSELVSLGTIPWTGSHGDIIDRELARVYLYHRESPIEGFSLQKEEVAGVVKADFREFEELAAGKRKTLQVTGFRETENGERIPLADSVDLSAFVPHQSSYYEELFKQIRSNVKI
ncbi:NUDIX hydrolase [Bacillus sp. FJAT-42376]|uniref:NUDIX hydrolase n=1 Tax=Bacillus sp. FJAT-42376 TaxID=2014076 RepID=UPI000F4EAE4D|nr:NUDIX domain-containing protein [Bacillus sp. FJAT-42376]AZB40918.1 NUDIX hydrolase [Bacillus sp. FJAT-42376]